MFAKFAAPVLLLTVIVQLKEPPKARLLLTLLVLVTLKSGVIVTVLLEVFDVTPLTVAEAVFVTKPFGETSGLARTV